MKGNLKDAIEYASKNPTSDFARQLTGMVKTGQFDGEAKKLNLDLTPIKGSNLDQPPAAVPGLNSLGNTVAEAGKGYVKGVADTYANAIPDFLNAAGSSKSSNTAVAVGEGALRSTASALNTIFAPITQGVKSLSETASNNPAVQQFASHPAVGKVLDFFGGVGGKVDAWAQKHPEAAKDLESGLTIGLTLAAQKGLDKPLFVKNAAEIKNLQEGFSPGGDVHNTMATYDNFANDLHNQNVKSAIQIDNAKAMAAGDKVMTQPELNNLSNPSINDYTPISPQDIYSDVPGKVFHPDVAKQVVSDAKDYFTMRGFPELGRQFEKAVDINKLTPDLVTKTASDIIGGASNSIGNSVVSGASNILSKGEEFLGKIKTARSAAQDQKLLEGAIEITKPVLNKKGKIAAFERAGTPGGVDKSFSATPSPRDLDIANSVKNIVSKSQGPIDNIVSVNEEISRVSKDEITPFLQKNPAIFNLKTFNSYIKGNVQIPDFIKADPVLQKTYDLARQRMIDVMDKYPKTMEGAWNARKEFDAIAERQLGNLDPFSEKATTIKQAVLDTRRAVNDFIADNTPNGDVEFKGKLKTLSNMYEARGNIAEQNYKLLDTNKIQRFIKQNPAKAEAIKRALMGIIGAGGVGVGIKAFGE